VNNNVENALAGEDSPYLLQHARNPVEWVAWGEAAFARAQAADKPVFLSIGYSTCHWCHVMERESFEDPLIAAFLNDKFVSIKVDREERPDVDQTYMTYVQAATGRGGWPMSVFLTPRGEPFFGGTYFPPRARHGQPGFLELLGQIAAAWEERGHELAAHAAEVAGRLRDAGKGHAGAGRTPPAADLVMRRAVEAFGRQFDAECGGFGGAPKFPRPAAPLLLLLVAERLGAGDPSGKAARSMALATLRALAQGGIRDHLGGGFHRYAVDRSWHIPHYEKMLYDQAQLVNLFLEGGRLSGDEEFALVAREILEYTDRDLAHPGGGFFSAEDADSLPAEGAGEKREGAFYVFTAAEAAAVLGADAALAAAAYDIRPGGNASPASDPHGELAGTNTLQRVADDQQLAARFGLAEAGVRDRLGAARRALLALRARRPRPHRDEKVVAAWNGMMIGAWARASMRLAQPALAARARLAAEFVWDRLWDEASGVLFRSFRARPPAVAGFAADYAQLIAAFLDLHEAGFESLWLRRALALQAALDRHHLDREDGCYFTARADGGLGLLSLKDEDDGAEPSPDGVAARNLLRFSLLLGRSGFAEAAARIFASRADLLAEAPQVCPTLAGALVLAESGTRVLIHPCDGPGGAELAAVARRMASPATVVTGVPSAGPDREWWDREAAWAAGLARAGQARAMVCRGDSCGVPVAGPAELATILAESNGG
jgi:uncharacterized protein